MTIDINHLDTLLADTRDALGHRLLDGSLVGKAAC